MKRSTSTHAQTKESNVFCWREKSWWPYMRNINFFPLNQCDMMSVSHMFPIVSLPNRILDTIFVFCSPSLCMCVCCVFVLLLSLHFFPTDSKYFMEFVGLGMNGANTVLRFYQTIKCYNESSNFSKNYK